MPQRILEELETRYAVPIERHEFTVQNRVAFDALQGTSDLNVAVADDLAVAAVQRGAPVFDTRHHPETVEFVFKHPGRIIERGISEGSQHRLQPLRERGGTGRG